MMILIRSMMNIIRLIHHDDDYDDDAESQNYPEETFPGLLSNFIFVSIVSSLTREPAFWQIKMDINNKKQ